MLDQRDLLMAKLIAGMLLGLEKTTAYLEQSLAGNADTDKARELVEVNKAWMEKVRQTLGMDGIL